MIPLKYKIEISMIFISQNQGKAKVPLSINTFCKNEYRLLMKINIKNGPLDHTS